MNKRFHDALLQDTGYNEVYWMWNTFIEHLRCTDGVQSKFWMSYIDIVNDIDNNITDKIFKGRELVVTPCGEFTCNSSPKVY